MATNYITAKTVYSNTSSLKYPKKKTIYNTTPMEEKEQKIR